MEQTQQMVRTSITEKWKRKNAHKKKEARKANVNYTCIRTTFDNVQNVGL